MERITLNTEVRDATGKSVAKKMRREGSIPGVIYREGRSQAIALNKREVVNFINASAGEQSIVDLAFSNGEKKIALLKEYQVDPASNELLHTDFFEVSMEEAITITVPVVAVGVAIGVKRDGGILQKLLREIEIECLPGRIPGHFEIDISKLEIGNSVHVSDIEVPEGVKVLSSLEDTVMSVIEPTKIEEPVAEEEEAEVAEGEEPEVEKKGKKEEEGQEEGAAEASKED